MFTLILTIIHPQGATIHSVPGFPSQERAVEVGEKWQTVTAHRQGWDKSFVVANGNFMNDPTY